jgi:hypothetical protein
MTRNTMTTSTTQIAQAKHVATSLLNGQIKVRQVDPQYRQQVAFALLQMLPLYMAESILRSDATLSNGRKLFQKFRKLVIDLNGEDALAMMAKRQIVVSISQRDSFDDYVGPLQEAIADAMSANFRPHKLKSRGANGTQYLTRCEGKLFFFYTENALAEADKGSKLAA